MPNFYYPYPALEGGILDLVLGRQLAVRRKEEIEAGQQAQVDQQNRQSLTQGITSAVGNVGGAFIGSAAANGMTDLTPMQRTQLAASFAPGLSNVGQAAGQISGAQEAGQRQQSSQDFAMQRMAQGAFADQTGSMIPNMQQLELQGQSLQAAPITPPDNIGPTPGMFAGSAEAADPGAVPSPTYNPASTQAYKSAQRFVAGFDARMGIETPSGQRDLQASLGQKYEESRQVMKRSQAPPAPATYEQLIQAGPHNGGIALTPDGGIISGKDFKFTPPSAKRFVAPETPEETEGILNSRIGAEPVARLRAQGYELVIQQDGSIDEIEPKPEKQVKKDNSYIDYVEKRMKVIGDIKLPLESINSEWSGIQTFIAKQELESEYRNLTSFDEFKDKLSSEDPQFAQALKVITEAQMMSITGDVPDSVRRAAKESAEYILLSFAKIGDAFPSMKTNVKSGARKLLDIAEELVQ